MHSARFFTAQVILFFSIASQAAFHTVRMEGHGSGRDNIALALEPSAVAPVTKLVVKSFKLVNEREIRQYVSQNVANIKRVSQSPKFSTQQKLDYIKSTVAAVADYRAKNWSKSAYAELEMDLSIKPFESFPEAKGFQPKQCNQYQHHLILEWEPGAQDLRPTQRGVLEALKVLKQICRG